MIAPGMARKCCWGGEEKGHVEYPAKPAANMDKRRKMDGRKLNIC